MSTTPSRGLVGVSTQISRVEVPHGTGDRVEVLLADQRVVETPATEHLVDEPEGPAVQIPRHDHV